MKLPQDSAPRSPIYFDDLKVGDRFVTDKFALDAEQITSFAAQFDPQPFHLNEAAARQTMFAGLAASGWHTAAITMLLLVTSGPPLANGVVGAGEVISLIPSRSRPERGVAFLLSKTLNQRGGWFRQCPPNSWPRVEGHERELTGQASAFLRVSGLGAGSLFEWMSAFRIPFHGFVVLLRVQAV